MNKDVQGWRKKFGVIGPSTNTIVQPDFEMMRPAGVTNHYSRIYTPNAKAMNNESFLAALFVFGSGRWPEAGYRHVGVYAVSAYETELGY